MTDYHPGLDGVIATESSISDIDGAKGVLSYRGFSIEELAQKSTFEETAYLLLTGELPSKDHLNTFSSRMSEAMNLPQDLLTLLNSYPKHSDSMFVLQSVVAVLGSYYDIYFDAEKLKTGDYKSDYFIDVSAKLL